MKILGLVGSQGGCAFYRLMTPFIALNKLGHDCRVTNRFFDNFHDVTGFDPEIIYCQRTDNPDLLDKLTKLNKPIIYDIDDNFINIPPFNPNYGLKETMPKIESYFNSSKLITVSTKELSNLYSKYNKPIHVIPNTIPDDWADLPINNRINSDDVYIGWSGSSSHVGDLDIIKKPLLKLKKKYSFKLVFFGYKPLWFDEFSSFYVPPVNVVNYMQTLKRVPFSIALAPIVTNKFNECKSSIKVFEYGMCKLPVVATNFGPYKSFDNNSVKKVDNTVESWYDAIEEFINNKNLRVSYGNNLFESVKEHNTISKGVELWEKTFQSALN
jgi:O-antigen biosynthesis protein